jgi:hypothetical protein
MTKDEALNLALEALEWEESQTAYPSRMMTNAITAIKQALAAQPAPVCIGWDDKTDTPVMGYTTPPAAQRQWVGLTDEDKLHIEIMGGKSDVMLADMVEAKLKEKNT